MQGIPPPPPAPVGIPPPPSVSGIPPPPPVQQGIPPPPPAASIKPSLPPAQSGRSDLLSQIRQGVSFAVLIDKDFWYFSAMFTNYLTI